MADETTFYSVAHRSGTAWPRELTFSFHSNKCSVMEGGAGGGGQVKEPLLDGGEGGIQVMSWGTLVHFHNLLGVHLEVSNLC